ncbi:protein containing Three-deoxy-D-manno-octulosonic-acid transferase [Rhodopirellula maiorica SM1]|uniref:3-deoxy-D-manno-octulosonic acid transferase n=1 Tax=Rhodopirellula maiorica SM1 TaxID=1265738 RepID=M5RN89_9BACT|nr:3-deoxy-D-manno-octulosonic acid transferase [Rhodopirellula maiorica]EMI15444.1 protein containing Three-deoxy-D-manno-octulosonic-acid transferase [Rhodopirellula maiorica SM1]
MFANLLYAAALLLLSPAVMYRMLRYGRYRRGVGEKLWGISKPHADSLTMGKPAIWLHAVSVGEVNLISGLVKRLEAAHPDHQVVVSTSTDTGYDLAIQRFGAERVFFCPLDFSWTVTRTLRNLKPDMLVLAELELWPNLIRIATNQGCPVMVANARLSQRSAAGYQRFAFLTRPIFARLTWVGAQNEQAAQRFAACGTATDRIETTGSIKFDNAPTNRDTVDVQSRVQWAGIDPWNRVWVVGSTQPGEEIMAIKIYKSLVSEHPELRLVLVPRHEERFDAVANLVTNAGLNVHRRSVNRSLHETSWSADTVILVDTIGELRHWWGVSQIATVGGSFGTRGGQNMLEPGAYGSAVSFGPDTKNFKEIANQLIEAGGAVRVADAEQLHQFVERCLTDIPSADALGRAARRVISEHQGATQRTIDALQRRLHRPQQQQRAA